MPLCCWPWKAPRKCGSPERTETPAPTPERKLPNPPPEIKVSEAPEYGNGNPRNKCALQPGHSLMDWIRLGNSGKDLAGTGGRLRAISPSELAAHNTPENAWIAIKGKVYNIVHYLDYHPGGPDELMRGAGKDATQLFDQVHAWVNYESLLSKCLIGPLKHPQISEEGFNSLFESNKDSPRTKEKNKSMESLKSSNQAENGGNMISNSISEATANKSSSESSLNVNESKTSSISSASNTTVGSQVMKKDDNVKNVLSEASKFKYPTLILTKADSFKFETSEAITDDNQKETQIKKTPPKFDWIQKTDSIVLIFYTKTLSNPQCEVLLSEDRLNLNIILMYDGHSFTFYITLEDSVLWPCQTTINHDTGKVELSFRKQTPKIWKNFGNTNKCDVKEPSIMIDEGRISCIITDKMEINHNTSLIIVKIEGDKNLTFPLGYHSRVFYDTEDQLSRSYTPIPSYLMPEFKPSKWSPDFICFMIKKYEHGVCSTWLLSRNINDKLTISKPLGSFSLKALQDVTQISLIAAGTGITPMLNLIQFSLQRRNPRCTKIDLLFFNRSEKDILWHDQLIILSSKDNRFSLTNVLSDPSCAWNGLKGHISQAVLKNHFYKTYLEENEPLESSIDNSNIHVSQFEQYFSNSSNLYICICGPSPFTQLAKTLLTGLGYNEDKLYCFLG